MILPQTSSSPCCRGRFQPRREACSPGGMFQTQFTRASNDGYCIWLKACPFLFQEALWWHMIIAQFLLGSWSYADRLQQISCYLLISALRAGQLPPPPCQLLGCWLAPPFYPSKFAPWFLNNLCLKSNNCLWHYLPCKIAEGWPRKCMYVRINVHRPRSLVSVTLITIFTTTMLISVSFYLQ